MRFLTLDMILPGPQSESPSQATRCMHERVISFYRHQDVFHEVLAGFDFYLVVERQHEMHGEYNHRIHSALSALSSKDETLVANHPLAILSG